MINTKASYVCICITCNYLCSIATSYHSTVRKVIALLDIFKHSILKPRAVARSSQLVRPGSTLSTM